MLPGRLKIPVTMLMTARIMVMVRAHDLPDHRPHVMMNPNTASMSNSMPMPVRNAVVKAIMGTLVNVVAQGISLRASANSSSGMRSQPPEARKVLSTIKAAPPNNITKLAMPSKIARSVMPLGREPRRGDEGADGTTGAEAAEGVTGAPHEGQKALSSSNVAPHFAQYATQFTLIRLNYL
jgi:hypothetical protein